MGKKTDIYNLHDGMNCSYYFLEANKDTDIKTIRENFLYKINEAYRQRSGIATWHKSYFEGDNTPDAWYIEEEDAYQEMRSLEFDVRMLCTSYLAILLSKINMKEYDFLIDALAGRWEVCPGIIFDIASGDAEYRDDFSFRYPRSDENVLMAEEEYIDKAKYLAILNEINYYNDNDGFNRFTALLAMIIGVEKKIMGETDTVCFKKRYYLPCGFIKSEAEQQERLAIIKKKQNKHL